MCTARAAVTQCVLEPGGTLASAAVPTAVLSHLALVRGLQAAVAIGLLVVLRLWRLARIFHAVAEIGHKNAEKAGKSGPMSLPLLSHICLSSRSSLHSPSILLLPT